MKRFKKIISLLLFVSILSVSCSKDENENAILAADLPTASLLIFPDNNTECNEGSIISDTETEVLFKWEEAINTSAYILTITNLNDATSREIHTISNEFLIRVLRGTPYSWVVKSIANIGNETADSEMWRFYNAGLPEESHPPLPAQAVNPKMGASIDSGDLTLQWEATDVDNDIASYTVLLDTNNSPVAEVGNPSTNSLNVTVTSGIVYYWKVITTDGLGNESYSQTFEFRVN
jgi:hypothetical protein